MIPTPSRGPEAEERDLIAGNSLVPEFLRRSSPAPAGELCPGLWAGTAPGARHPPGRVSIPPRGHPPAGSPRSAGAE